MNIERILIKKQIARRIDNFQKFTGLSVALLSSVDDRVIIGDCGSGKAFQRFLPIRINGEEMLRLVETDTVVENEKALLAMEFLQQQLEEVLNAEFNKQDLVKTTAQFWKEMNFLYNFFSEINYSLDVNQLCRIITEKVTKLFNVSRVRLIFLNERNKPLVRACNGQVIDEVSPLFEQVDLLISLYVIRTSEDILLDDMENLPAELKTELENEHIDFNSLRREFEPLIYCALKTPEKTLGTIKVCCKKNSLYFSSDDLKMLSSLASQISLVLENVQMIATVRENEKMRQEMEFASSIQKGLLPKQVPQVDDLDIAGRCVSANAIGGDYYDFIKLESNIHFILADVAGHGMSSALYMSNVRSILRSILTDHMTLPEVAHRVNDYICSDAGTSGIFVTLFYARYIFSTGMLEYVNSGHNPPILFHGANGAVDLLDTEGTPAGFIEDTEYCVKSTDMQRGDVLVMYTDGFIESINDQGVMFGTDRLIDVVKRSASFSARQLIDKIYEAVYAYSGGIDQKDDMTILVVKHE
ncbi:MAG: GAF domain-containing SpoIIE family protein phosphatase [Candidatus Zhuqueibacterota bacterium]